MRAAVVGVRVAALGRTADTDARLDVGLELAAVVELEPLLGEARDLRVVLDLDLAVDDHLARAHV